MVASAPSRSETLRVIAQRSLGSLGEFSRLVLRKPLHPYQLEAANGITPYLRSDLQFPEFVVTMSRQSGKNEMSAQFAAWNMNRHRITGGTIIKAAPTFKPQIIISMQRLERCLTNWWNRGKYKTRHGYKIILGGCVVEFFSADEQSNVVGSTASLYMEVDEAQDVVQAKYDKDFVPMRATTNAPVIYYGTTWTKNTLLAQKKRAAEEQERKDGIRRVFSYPWWDVAEINPLYGRFIQDRIAEMGEDHPIFKTQYALEEIDETGSLFSERHKDTLVGEHPPQENRVGDFRYIIGIDVAGESEQGIDEVLRNVKPRQDSTVITVARLDYSAWTPEIPYPDVQVVKHYWWTGRNHESQYQDISRIVDAWKAIRVVVDGGGVGAGIASFLKKRFGSVIEVYQPNGTTISQLGYHLLAMLNMERLSVYLADGDEERANILREFWTEVEQCQREMLQMQRMRWFVPEEKGHDDFVKSLGLCAWGAKNLPVPTQSEQQRIFDKGEKGATLSGIDGQRANGPAGRAMMDAIRRSRGR
jgi:hypothetical protein